MKAKLVMECEGGRTRVLLETLLGPAGAAANGHRQDHLHQAMAGPARLRRRARRRAEARDAGGQAGHPHQSAWRPGHPPPHAD